MKIFDVEVKRIDEDHLALDGKVVRWDYDGAIDGTGLTCQPVGWIPQDQYADVEEIVYEWLEAQMRCF